MATNPRGCVFVRDLPITRRCNRVQGQIGRRRDATRFTSRQRLSRPTRAPISPGWNSSANRRLSARPSACCNAWPPATSRCCCVARPAPARNSPRVRSTTLGARRDQPFIPVNCGAIPDMLVESELFGHVRGAFTDARDTQLGLVAQADGGTLFLDEVDSLSMKAQISLLRFLQDGSFRPLGARSFGRSQARVIAATNSRSRTARAKRRVPQRPVLPARDRAGAPAAAARARGRHATPGRQLPARAGRAARQRPTPHRSRIDAPARGLHVARATCANSPT